MGNFIERPRFTCALGGALMAAAALPETIPIVHSVAGCVGSVAWAQQGGSALQVGGPCGCLGVPGSNLREREVVFGGADRLREQIGNTIEVMEGRLFVVLTGCVSEVIGDDVDSVVREFQRSGVSIVAAHTGGFRGDSYFGYEELLKTLFRDYVKGVRKKTPRLVNLWGVVPGMDVFWRISDWRLTPFLPATICLRPWKEREMPNSMWLFRLAMEWKQRKPLLKSMEPATSSPLSLWGRKLRGAFSRV
jgi:nitrogenase molybdenum-iron protein beta chain